MIKVPKVNKRKPTPPPPAPAPEAPKPVEPAPKVAQAKPYNRLPVAPPCPYVGISDEQYTCIVLEDDGQVCYIIAMQADELCVSKAHPRVVHRDYPPTDYSVVRAAKLYLDHAKLTRIQDSAKAVLEAILAEKSYNVKQEQEQEDMAGKAKAATTAEKEKKATKAAPAAKPGKEKKEAKKEEAANGRSKFLPAQKIKVLKKDDIGAREGTKKFELRTLILESATVNDALGKSCKDGTPVTGTNLQNMVNDGIISIT